MEKRTADKETKKLQLKYLKTCLLSSFQINKDGMDIEKIGNIEGLNILHAHRKAFLNLHHIRFGRSLGTDDLGTILIEHLKAALYKNSITKS